MHQRQSATKHPAWMRLAARLAGGIAIVLLVPLLIGYAFDAVIGIAPLGLLIGLATGMLFGIVYVIRTIQARFKELAPAESEDVKENS